MERPLWLTDMPEDLKQNWQELKEKLLSCDEDWQVWTNWYEDRLVGGPKPNGRLVIQSLERERILITDEDWKKGAAHVNGLIADMEARFQVPQQAPETIEVEVDDEGILHQRAPKEPEEEDGADDMLAGAWAGLKAQCGLLLGMREGQNDPEFQGAMQLYNIALGDSLKTTNIYQLGQMGIVLQQIASKVGEGYFESAASIIEGMALNHQEFIQHFKEWHEYQNRKPEAEPTAEAVGSARKFINFLIENGYCSEDLAEKLYLMIKAADAGQQFWRQLVLLAKNLFIAPMGKAVKQDKPDHLDETIELADQAEEFIENLSSPWYWAEIAIKRLRRLKTVRDQDKDAE